MNLGIFAVGLIIFAIAFGLLCIAFTCKNDMNYDTEALVIAIIISLYCAISGTYLLNLAGQI